MSHNARQQEYVSPLSARYCSPEMSHLFSAHWKAHAYRKLWIALAKAQKNQGLNITANQIAQMESQAAQIDFEKIREYEKKFRHDVVAHIHAFGDLCPEAKPILHLGATSSFATDNADLIQLREALSLLFYKLLQIISLLAKLAESHAADPCLSYTHFQAAQPTTIGKRMSIWLQDLLLDAKEWFRLIQEMPFLGAKGATGTQSSFLALLNNDASKVVQLERDIAALFEFKTVLPISGQTYTRKIDVNVLNALASFAASAHKIATDFRLLAHEGEMLEPFSATQVGSSAMPYKRNPIYSERICGLARFAISLAQNPLYTEATQWLERSLDDSSNRRLTIPEAFLSIDAILNLFNHILSGLNIQATHSQQLLLAKLPILCMENILMEAVGKGGDRQALHESLRTLTFSALKHDDPLESLISEIEKNPAFQLTRKEIEEIADIKLLIGRAPDQVAEFLSQHVKPFLSQFPASNISIPRVDM